MVIEQRYEDIEIFKQNGISMNHKQISQYVEHGTFVYRVRNSLVAKIRDALAGFEVNMFDDGMIRISEIDLYISPINSGKEFF